MKGGFLHNRVLIAPIAQHFRSLGAKVSLEHPVESGRSPRSVDLYVELASMRIAVEAECTVRRVLSDLDKARVLHADLLLIVVPTQRIASAAKRLIQTGPGLMSGGPEVQVLPLGPAMAHLRRRFPFLSNPIHNWKSNGKTPQAGRESQR